MDDRTKQYAETLAGMIRLNTVSYRDPERAADRSRFQTFQLLLADSFPRLFGACGILPFGGGIALHWHGAGQGRPVLFMNHHDVVEAAGEWTHAPFSGDLSDGKIWGRGTLDDKGGLWAMLQAGEELAAEGFVPARDIWFFSSCTEETTGEGAREMAAWFRKEGICFEMSFDEGGMILPEPIAGAKGTFAMIGVGEKGCADLKFIARSEGGHASSPGKNTPLVRLGKFMAAVEKTKLFDVQISPTVCEMLRRLGPSMGALAPLLKKPERIESLLKRVLPALSGEAKALTQTTLAFTMSQGSGGTNVLPQEAWVIGNMRFSHHQGQAASFAAVRALAAKYGVEMEILDPGFSSRIADYNGTAFKLVEKALGEVFPEVKAVPYLMTGASDSRFFDAVCGQCIRFLPFTISHAQMASIHGTDECLDLDTLVPAVEYYKVLIREASNGREE